MSYRTGIGYDVHRLAHGRKLMLGGVEVPYSRGLDGHSDADVVLHALCDALLGAVGLGDIGEHFPSSDARYKGVSSTVLLDKVYEMVSKAGYKTVNIDIVILAEEPHLKEHKLKMCQHIAGRLGLGMDAINVKATTNEGLGFVGNKEGIAAYASVLLEKK